MFLHESVMYFGGGFGGFLRLGSFSTTPAEGLAGWSVARRLPTSFVHGMVFTR